MGDGGLLGQDGGSGGDPPAAQVAGLFGSTCRSSTVCVRTRRTRVVSGAIAECNQWWPPLSRSSLVYPVGYCFRFCLPLILCFNRLQPRYREEHQTPLPAPPSEPTPEPTPPPTQTTYIEEPQVATPPRTKRKPPPGKDDPTERPRPRSSGTRSSAFATWQMQHRWRPPWRGCQVAMRNQTHSVSLLAVSNILRLAKGGGAPRSPGSCRSEVSAMAGGQLDVSRRPRELYAQPQSLHPHAAVWQGLPAPGPQDRNK